MTTSILFILFYGMGRWPLPFLVEEQEVTLIKKERESDGHLHSYYSSLRDGGMATSILLLVL